MYLKHSKQRGSALVIAVFIIIVMLALTLSLAQLLRSGSETVVYEVQGSRSLFAAQSALELSLTELFPLDAVTSDCSGLTLNYTFAGNALDSCSASISCRAYTDSSSAEATLFQLVSTANCYAGDIATQRTVQIEVR